MKAMPLPHLMHDKRVHLNIIGELSEKCKTLTHKGVKTRCAILKDSQKFTAQLVLILRSRVLLYLLTLNLLTMAETSYQDIKIMSASFKEMLTSNRSTLPFDVDNSQLVILVDVATDLQAVLSTNPQKLALIIGLEHNRLTVCLLPSNGTAGLRSDPQPPLPPGQETWPDGDTITYTENAAYNNFFTP